MGGNHSTIIKNPAVFDADISGVFKVGIAGPVGSGKTALAAAFSQHFQEKFNLAVITNDIYTKEDAEFLIKNCVLPPERVRGVETGACPHSAIRDDASMNIEAVIDLQDTIDGLELLFIESGGDNLTISFSPELVDVWMYVIDVSAGDKIPRKGGPGIMRSDLLVINKTDLAPLVGASLAVMDRDSKMMRGDRPYIFTNVKSGEGLGDLFPWIEQQLLSYQAEQASQI